MATRRDGVTLIERQPDRDPVYGVHTRIVRVQVQNAAEALRWLVESGDLAGEDRRDAFQAEACIVALARRLRIT